MSRRDDWSTVAAIYKGYLPGDAWLYSDDGFTDDAPENRAFTSLAHAKRHARKAAFDQVRFVQPHPKENPNYFEVLERRPR